MNIKAFERPSLTEIAYEEIKKSICIGKYMPGDKLIIDDLEREFNISNTPIKEALNRLAAEGLVESLPRKGMRVREIGLKEVKEIYDLRLMYETYCAKTAIKVIDDREDIKTRLCNIINEFEQLIENHSFYDYTGHSKFDEEFHLSIISLTGNDLLIGEYKKLTALNMAIRNYSCRELPLKRCKETLTEHRLIYEALIEKNEDKLIKSIEMHISNVMNDMVKFIDND